MVRDGGQSFVSLENYVFLFHNDLTPLTYSSYLPFTLLFPAFSSALLNQDGAPYTLPAFLGARARARAHGQDSGSSAPAPSPVLRALAGARRGAELAWDVLKSAAKVALLPEIGCDTRSPFAPHCQGGKLATFSGPRCVTLQFLVVFIFVFQLCRISHLTSCCPCCCTCPP